MSVFKSRQECISCLFYCDLLCLYYMWLYVLRLGFLPGALLQAKLARSRPGIRWRPNKRKEVHCFQGWSSQGLMDSWYVHLWHQVHANRTDRKCTTYQWGITYFTWWYNSICNKVCALPLVVLVCFICLARTFYNIWKACL